MRIKICGITTARDALIAEELGADAIGVVVCSDSPRSVPVKRAKEIFAALRPSTMKVCVTDTCSESDLEVITHIRPDAIQLHSGIAVPERCGIKVIRAVRPGEAPVPGFNMVLVDGSLGKGTPYDSDFAAKIVRETGAPVILAGGLTPDNVVEAIRTVSPSAVDVSSGVEKSPGIKDPKRVAEFIRHCREVEACL
ncbi:MAG: phosphoribosylanthranilate isomerase [Methanomicrobiaceae archaeon]|nr:phosphoribosylanthranilate isomerase [Methanomicrobiaceae archaeon]